MKHRSEAETKDFFATWLTRRILWSAGHLWMRGVCPGRGRVMRRGDGYERVRRRGDRRVEWSSPTRLILYLAQRHYPLVLVGPDRHV